MHRLQEAETSFSLPALQESARNCSPHSLQELRDVQGVQAVLHRPPLHGSRHEVVLEMRRSGKTQGMLHMQQEAGEETVPRVSMAMGITCEGIQKLVSALHRMPQMQDVRRGESIAAFSCSVCCMYTMQCQEGLLSMRRASQPKRIW